jgi:hypothetical protein
MAIKDILDEYMKLNPDMGSKSMSDEIERIEALIVLDANDFNNVKLNGVEYHVEYSPFPKGTRFDKERWKADREKFLKSDDKNAFMCMGDYIILPDNHQGSDENMDIYQIENRSIF